MIYSMLYYTIYNCATYYKYITCYITSNLLPILLCSLAAELMLVKLILASLLVQTIFPMDGCSGLLEGCSIWVVACAAAAGGCSSDPQLPVLLQQTV